MSINLRPCSHDDIPAIADILHHYVLNTVVTFAFDPPPRDEILQKWRNAIDAGYPYVVAIQTLDDVDKLVGFCSASGFRRERRGYRHTAELSLFCHPDHTGQGIGSLLLNQLIQVLKSPLSFPDYLPAPRDQDNRTRMLVACMSHDDSAWNNGFGLRDFYLKHGFEEVGHLKKVGRKFDRWIDTRYLQLDLW